MSIKITFLAATVCAVWVGLLRPGLTIWATCVALTAGLTLLLLVVARQVIDKC